LLATIKSLFMAAVPYGGKKKSWCWASYLEQDKAIAAPTKLFKEVSYHTPQACLELVIN
jgi:hypothetical protein